MRFVLSLAALLFASGVQAETELEPWQEKSAEALSSFNKFKEVSWEQKISLWIFVENDGSDWNSIQSYVCKTLKGNGKPDSAFVVVTFWDHQAALAGNSIQYAKNPC
ncbi:hypothetical protein [Pseudovibrio sp. Ad26]|uniref:hypothetical protein n=1 Tax=Pseudovibrio sp. Ad26 TaxID=989410 RepID=UPI0007AE668F|nr:hypothetical protein [Pseudovibrio sp. Ad26]KZL05539.1 hypothetical protein PsAD26_04336 [Pseudovibrio sp. Ad26]